MQPVVVGCAAAAAAVLADQASKAVVLANADALAGGVTVVPGFDLMAHRNEGVAFGALDGLPWWALVILALALTSYLALRMIGAERRLEATAYGAVIGGALGNVIDRVLLGSVTDFIDLYVGRYHWPAFNVADICIVGSVLCILALEIPWLKERLGSR